ncbi:MAG: hypothetical protein Q9209_006072 [Squamulea sp. 1 TL-2023]
MSSFQDHVRDIESLSELLEEFKHDQASAGNNRNSILLIDALLAQITEDLASSSANQQRSQELAKWEARLSSEEERLKQQDVNAAATVRANQRQAKDLAEWEGRLRAKEGALNQRMLVRSCLLPSTIVEQLLRRSKFQLGTSNGVGHGPGDVVSNRMRPGAQVGNT